MNIKILKLVNGDDIISDIDESDKIVLKNPAKLMMFQTDEGIEMALVPWCHYINQEKFTIDKIHVITMFSAPEELRNGYNNKFGSGIVTPPTDIIV